MKKRDLEIDTFPQRKILILGGSGFVGRHLLTAWGDLAIGTHKNTACGNTIFFDPISMDLTSIKGIDQCSHAVILYGEREPDVCFMQPEITRALNVESTKKILLQCQTLGIVPMFASTELVFSGAKGMYEESEEPDPILLYGKYKVEVEKFIIENLDRFVIFRLSKIMGMQKNDRSIFANWLIQFETSSTRKIQGAKDQFFSLIGVSDVAKLLRLLIEGDANGIFHFSDGIRYNRLELLRLFLSEYQIVTDSAFAIEPVSINDFKLREARPLDVSLSNSRIMSLKAIRFVTPALHIQQLLQYLTR